MKIELFIFAVYYIGVILGGISAVMPTLTGFVILTSATFLTALTLIIAGNKIINKESYIQGYRRGRCEAGRK